MEIFIFTKRFEEYESLFSVFRGTDLLFTGTADPGVLMLRGGFPLPRIVLADPRLMEEQSVYNGGMTDMNDPDVRIIIGSPVSGNGLAREIKKEMEAQGIVISRYVPPEIMEESAVRYRPMGNERQVRKLHSPGIQVPRERKVIGIAGMSPGAGCTFLTMLLAEELASSMLPGNPQITVLSLEDASIYNSLGMKERFKDRLFTDAAELKDLEIREPVNMDEGISWAVSSPESEAGFLLPGEKAATARSLPGDFILWDMGCRELRPVLRQARDTLDTLILVIDPLPSALLTGYANLDTVRGSACPVIFLLNKWNLGVDQASVLDYLEVEDPVLMSMMDTALIYRAEFACENPYREREIREMAADTMRELIARMHLKED